MSRSSLFSTNGVTGLLLVLLYLVPLRVMAQEGTSIPDTTIFPARTFYELIREYHPIIRQADLYGEQARQVLLQARGGFDPKVVSHYDRKEFGRDLYYDHWQNKLAVPLWPGGIDLNVSYDRNDPRGQYINPEERTPPSGLAGVGLSMPLGRTLLFDARRNAVLQAKEALKLAEAERIGLINKTLYNAAKAYWDWFLAHRQLQLLTEGYSLAEERFQALRQQAALGDVALIDTTEALITVQDRLVQRQQAEVDEQNARLGVSVFLWNKDNNPVDLPREAVPQVPPLRVPADTLLQELLVVAARQHPELLKLDTEIRQLTIEERLRRALIQPQIALSATLLSQTPSVLSRYDWSSYYSFQPQNYKIGVDMVFPLFLRKERGKLQEIQLKNQQMTLDRQQTGRVILTDVQVAYNQLQALARQVVTQQQTIQNQEILLRGELQKFALGESSLFLINSRETKLINLRLKGEELKTKYQQTIAELYFVAGTIGEPDN